MCNCVILERLELIESHVLLCRLQRRGFKAYRTQMGVQTLFDKFIIAISDDFFVDAAMPGKSHFYLQILLSIFSIATRCHYRLASGCPKYIDSRTSDLKPIASTARPWECVVQNSSKKY